MRLVFCAEGGSRTHTPVRELRPERSASAYSATSASSVHSSKETDSVNSVVKETTLFATIRRLRRLRLPQQLHSLLLQPEQLHPVQHEHQRIG